MPWRDFNLRLACYAVMVDEQARVLLTWFNGSPRTAPVWSLPGGGVELGETLEEALVREVHEETGYVVEVERYLGSQTRTAPTTHDEDKPFMALRVFFTVRVVGGTLGTIEVGGSTDRAEWLPLSRLTELPHEDIVSIGLQLAGPSRR